MFFYGDRAPDESWEQDEQDRQELNALDRADLAEYESEKRDYYETRNSQ